jgi:hypothetical protein
VIGLAVGRPGAEVRNERLRTTGDRLLGGSDFPQGSARRERDDVGAGLEPTHGPPRDIATVDELSLLAELLDVHALCQRYRWQRKTSRARRERGNNDREPTRLWNHVKTPTSGSRLNPMDQPARWAA